MINSLKRLLVPALVALAFGAMGGFIVWAAERSEQAKHACAPYAVLQVTGDSVICDGLNTKRIPLP